MRLWPWRKAGKVPVSLDGIEQATVLAESHDEAAATSSVLAEAGAQPSGDVIVRQLVFLDPQRVDELLARCTADGYTRVPGTPGDPLPPEGEVAVAVARAEEVDSSTLPVLLSRERALMTSAASRVGGTFAGWSILNVPGR